MNDEEIGRKAPVMEATLENLVQMISGRSRKDPACVFCGSTTLADADFRDEIARREFKISKLCQRCQDEVFGDEPEAA